ncbi:Cleavage stimulation factor subunit 2 [Linderina macrospora]|uniref:Cleavage stimulation factor subunit 2 n=1 Tax=Linderina macrospora TaxID=4868 RepID=A0ACC1JG99_9FUNG|nr:Cleavage stimulation factor subunit 2 [Linderina macrospora]
MEYRREPRENNIVFVGNVPFDTTEEQLIGILRQAGPVTDFRLVFDRETGKQRGFGFCEYADIQIAASAVKNLSGTPVGGRPMKLDFAEREVVRRHFNTDGLSLGGGSGSAAGMQPAMAKKITIESVNEVVGSLSDQQKSELIAQFQTFAKRNMNVARRELLENPALAHALYAAMGSLGVANPEDLRRAQRGSGRAASTGSVPRYPPPPPPPMAAMQSMPPASLPQYPSQRPPPPPHMPSSVPPSMPVVAGAAPISLPKPQIPQTPQTEAPEFDNEQVINQLLSLTDEQLAQLPEEHRNKIMELRSQFQM